MFLPFLLANVNRLQTYAHICIMVFVSEANHNGVIKHVIEINSRSFTNTDRKMRTRTMFAVKKCCRNEAKLYSSSCDDYLSLYSHHLTWNITVMLKWARWHLKSPASRLLSQPFAQAQIKENIKATRHWPFCKGNSPVTTEFPTQRASNEENVSIWWHHHVLKSKTVAYTSHISFPSSGEWRLIGWSSGPHRRNMATVHEMIHKMK